MEELFPNSQGSTKEMNDHEPPAEPTPDRSELSAALTRLGLGPYEERLRGNGFEDWETVTAITETDMAELGFKLGDRRKLQRAIGERGRSSGLDVEYRHSSLESSEGPLSVDPEAVAHSSQPVARTTRHYRRHPRPDSNAPQKPKTAYVLFGEHVRRDPALSGSSFAEIAKETGKRWWNFSPEERAKTWETPAADRLKQYKEEFGCYKRTENYKEYQKYLKEFQQRHDPESMASPDDNASLSPQIASLLRLPISQGQDELKAARRESADIEISTLKAQMRDATSPVQAGMNEVRRVPEVLGIDPDSIRATALPGEDMTAQAVESFLYGTGSLLYFWDEEEARDLVRSVYHPTGESASEHATEVFAMAAVGSYCDGEAHTASLQEEFLHFFLCMLLAPSEMVGLRRMRLFACLAICLFTTSVESARSLILSALDIGRQTFSSPSFEAETSREERVPWWNIFRSVVFLESWFAYNTSHESRVTELDLTLYNPSRPHAGCRPGAFQERVGDLGQLAAYIALDLKTAAQPKAAQAQAHFKSLDEWHRTLPPPMQLRRLSVADPHSMNWQTKRSLLQLHILFLGLFIEPHRNCLLDLGRARISTTPTDTKDLDTLKNVEEQCVLAARQSARVASLLQTDNLIRSRCWVSVYTCYTGCAILLYSASQKLLGLFGEEVGQDLLYASSHLNALSLCSYSNPMARKLYIRLQVIFNDIREVVVSSTYRTLRESHSVAQDVAVVPLFQHNAVEGTEDVRNVVLDITRRVIEILQESIRF